MGLKKGMTNNPAGRKKGSKNRSTEETRDFLELHKYDILKVAYNRALAGSDMLMSKLLDKIAPSLAHNKNENNNLVTFEQFLLMEKQKREELRLLDLKKTGTDDTP